MKYEQKLATICANILVPTLSTAAPHGVKLPVTSPYAAKDQLKADQATKFIGRGSNRSSTYAYSHAFGALANSGKYDANDVVFVSAEGNRAGRLPFDEPEVKRAADAGARFITDNFANRVRSYNIGERELAMYLRSLGYTDSVDGVWSK
jgi:hypothetical protein